MNIVAAPASSIPTTTKTDTVCIGDKANLYASGNAHWFDAPVNGNLVYIGNNFQTGSLSTNTTFYVADQPSQTFGVVGPVNTNFSSAGNYTTTKANYLIFNAFLPFKLKKITVDASVAGNRTFQLRDIYGDVITQKTVTLVAGKQDVTLDFFVPAGLNLQLGLSSGSAVTALYSSTTASANIGYPFNFSSMARIVGSSMGDNVYPFCYNWQIEGTPQVCNSGVRKAVTAYVVAKAPVDIVGLQSTYLHTQNGVSLSVTPPGGVLTGPGLIGFDFYPKLVGVGSHQFKYVYQYGNCVSEITKLVTVDFDNADMKDGFSIQLWDNPGKQQRLYLVTNQSSVVDVRLISGTGQQVKRMSFNALNGSNLFDLDFSNLSRGLYFIEVRMAFNGARKVIRLLN
ncbi:MAG: T9SS type A sorting domain-containing protein [Chitinophagaceae bacterium]|nr:T9SS type A sorting domain-containing protein [Chitinophagaceae bacterium]